MLARHTAPTIVLALLAGAFAGCTNTPTEAPEPSTPCIVTSPDDRHCEEEPAPASGDPDARPHLHDYWAGRDRVPLQEMTVRVGYSTCPADPGQERELPAMRPDESETIYQGTAKIEVIPTWTEPRATDALGPPAGFGLRVKTAIDAQANPVTNLSNGVMASFDVKLEQADLPHQRLSAWEFVVTIIKDDAKPCLNYQGEVTLEVVMIAGHEIPLFPAHPDLWQGARELPLLTIGQNIPYFVETPFREMSSGDELYTQLRPDDGAFVPFNASWVWVNLTDSGPEDLRLRLGFHGATTRTFSWPAPFADDGTTRTYRLKVGDAGDGPYAKQSQWRFMLAPSEYPVYSGSANLVAKSVRDVPGVTLGVLPGLEG